MDAHPQAAFVKLAAFPAECGLFCTLQREICKYQAGYHYKHFKVLS